MKNILITGGAGFIGSHLVDQLLGEGGWSVTVVDDFNDFYDWVRARVCGLRSGNRGCMSRQTSTAP